MRNSLKMSMVALAVLAAVAAVVACAGDTEVVEKIVEVPVVEEKVVEVEVERVVEIETERIVEVPVVVEKLSSRLQTEKLLVEPRRLPVPGAG